MKTVLSPTALKKYSTCPRQYQAMYITKEIKYKQSPAAVRGEELHAFMEHAVRDGWSAIRWPDESNKDNAFKFVTAVLQLKAAGWIVKPELSAAIDTEGNIKDWWDKAPDSFMRSRIDVCATRPGTDYAIVIDWKTGKRYDVDTLQLAVNAMCLQPVTGLNKYRMMFAYLDSGDVVEHSCTLPDVPFSKYDTEPVLHEDVKTVYDLVHRLAQSEAQDDWPMQRNRFCHWCELRTCPNRQ